MALDRKAARAYNLAHVPIFAPAGFEAYTSIPEAPDAHAFEDHITAHQIRLGLKPDGHCGPATIAALAREAHSRMGGGLIVGPRCFRLPKGIRVATWLTEDWLGSSKSHVRKSPCRLGVLHYDVTNSARDTERVLARRGYSTHILIDADGTVYQSHNPTTHTTIHAGTPCNRASVGVDLNNPALRQYERGARKRPEVKVRVHGHLTTLLAFWPEQHESMKHVARALRDGMGISLAYPTEMGVISRPEKWKGWIGHYHITRNKVDPAQLDWLEVFG